MKICHHFALLCIGLFFGSSCQKDEPARTLSSSEDKGLTSELLVFKNSEEVKEAIARENGVDAYGRTLNQSAEGQVVEALRSVSGEAVQLSYDVLVPERGLRRLLNSSGEIQVADTLYCVNGHGTFYAHISDSLDLRRVASTYSPSQSSRVSDDLLQIGNVFLVETFKGVDFLNDEFAEASAADEDDARSFPNYGPDFGIPNPNLDNFAKEKASRTTVLGKFFQGLGIRKSWVKQFPKNSKRRLNCAVFDYNYVFKHSIGVTAKIQKKMWYGGWGKVKNWSLGHVRVGFKNVVVKYKYPDLMKDIQKNIESASIGEFPRPKLADPEYIRSLRYPSWFNNSHVVFEWPKIYVGKDLTTQDVFSIFTSELKNIVRRVKGMPGDYQHHYALGLPTLTDEEKRMLENVTVALPLYTLDGIYVLYTSGWFSNHDRSDQAEATMLFAEAYGSVTVGINANPYTLQLNRRPSLSVKADKNTGDLMGGEFFGCGYMHGDWVGYNLYW